MRKVKKYTEFRRINETTGFTNSAEYSNLVKNKSTLSKEEINEYFYDIIDEGIADISLYSFIGNGKDGDIMNDRPTKDSDEYFIIYQIRIVSKNGSVDLLNIKDNINNIRKVAKNLTILSDSIDSFTKRIGEDKIISCYIHGTGNEIKSTIRIKGEKIENDNINKLFSKWSETHGENFTKGIKTLIDRYRSTGLSNPILDTSEYPGDNENYIHIGFMMIEDEIISVATYNKNTDEFIIDWNEFNRSLREYRNQEN